MKKKESHWAVRKGCIATQLTSQMLLQAMIAAIELYIWSETKYFMSMKSISEMTIKQNATRKGFFTQTRSRTRKKRMPLLVATGRDSKSAITVSSFQGALSVRRRVGQHLLLSNITSLALESRKTPCGNLLSVPCGRIRRLSSIEIKISPILG